nr:Chain G, R-PHYCOERYTHRIN [Agarophyton chilense]1EYX_H Chain H, R-PHYCOERYTHRIN [Agarophyton chilense]
AAFRAA